MSDAFRHRPASLADYLSILRSRIWIVLVPLVLGPVAALLVAHGQAAVYQASASVYIDRSPAVAAATGFFDQGTSEDPARFFQTQAALARDPVLTARVARSHKLAPADFRADSSVQPSSNSDLLVFNVQSGDPARAALLANAYAKEFVAYTPSQVQDSLAAALTTVRARLAALAGKKGSTRSQTYTELLTKESQLQTALALQSGAAPRLVQPAGDGSKISPQPKRDALLGLALGLVVGIGSAFLADTFDKRVRSEHEVEELLGLPLVARLPPPPRGARSGGELAIVNDPRSPSAEAVRQLRTNLEFLTVNGGAKVIMVTSAQAQEGKSTTVASLAVAFARSGRRVALVDLDLRKPMLHRFFGIAQAPGVTDVAVRRTRLEDGLKPIFLSGIDQSQRFGPYLNPDAPNGDEPVAVLMKEAGQRKSGFLGVLPAGTPRSDPGEFFSSDAFATMIDELRAGWDVVLIDTPPLPAVGDALSVSARVDAVLAVVRFGSASRPMLRELRRQLSASPADVLGFVLSGSTGADAYYGYGYGHGEPATEQVDVPSVSTRRRSGGAGRRAKSQRS